MDTKRFNSSDNDQRKVAYFGAPSDSVYRFDLETDPPYGVPLDPRTDIADLGTIASSRQDIDADRAQLAIAILADYLGDQARVARLYNAFSQRIRYIFLPIIVGWSLKLRWKHWLPPLNWITISHGTTRPVAIKMSLIKT
jgi:hypothetical protein